MSDFWPEFVVDPMVPSGYVEVRDAEGRIAQRIPLALSKDDPPASSVPNDTP